MHIAICDDSPEERARLARMAKEYFTGKGVSAAISEYGSGEALLDAFIPRVFDLVFLDIYMDGVTGVETARQMKATDPSCTVIFTTTSREHGAEAFDVEAFHYLIKPIGAEKLYSVLDKWYELLCEASFVEFKCGKTMRQVCIRDILYIDVMGRRSTVHTISGRIETSLPLASVETLLPKGQFCRPIRYCLAAIRHIKTIRDDELLLDNGETLAISRLEKENLRQQLASYRLRALRRR